MIKITLITKEGLSNCGSTAIDFDGSIGAFIVDNYYDKGIAYSVFKGIPSLDTDITTNFEELLADVGDYTVIEIPSASVPVGWMIAISLAVSVAMIALMPKVKMPSNVVRQEESANNQLGARSNTARPLQRVPLIKGTVKSIPDVIMPPYRTYQDLQTKVEHGYYCVGEGNYTIASINDGDTSLSTIDGASAQIYGPYKSPNNSSPDVQIGEFIDETIVAPYRISEADQIKLPYIDQIGKEPVVITAEYSPSNPPGTINGSLYDRTATTFKLTFNKVGYIDWLSPDYYVGNIINLIDYSINDGFIDYDISGTATITDIYHADGTPGYVLTVEPIDFSIPTSDGLINPGSYSTTKFSTPYNQWFYMTRSECDRGFVNVNAPNGLYKDAGGATLETINVDFEIEVETVDESNSPNGDAQIISSSLSGNSQINRGITVNFTLPFQSRFRARVRRTTARYTSATARYEQDIVLEDVYGLLDIDTTDFGDVTTIQTKTIATSAAISVDNRELNCIATEQLYKYLGSGTFDDELSDNASAIQSYITDFMRPTMGGRQLDELDADQLLILESDILAYFGTYDHIQFNYTLDSSNITFQDYTQMLFNAIYSVAYRDGVQVKGVFEQPITIPSMLFTHRSKLPGSETYSRNFNLSQLNDGVEFVWIDPTTNTNETIYIPSDKSALNPKKIEMPGFRNEKQAQVRAYREYQRIVNEKITIDLSTTAEGRYCKPGNVISIVKGTRTNTTDGEVIGVSSDGLTLTLSQDVTFTPYDTHYILLKKLDGSVDSIGCVAGTDTNQVILARLPEESIILGLDYQRGTEFSFGNEARNQAQLYIVREVEINDNFTCNIKATNYTDLFYLFDHQSLNAFDDGFDVGFS